MSVPSISSALKTDALQPPTTTFIIKRVNFSSYIFNVIGTGLTCASAVNLYNCRKEPKGLLFGVSLFIGLLGILSLHASSEASKAEKCQQLIQQCEQDQDYSRALLMARRCFEETGLTSFAATAKELEMKLLANGQTKKLFKPDGTPRVTLDNLLTMVGMDADCTTLDQINAWAQKNLLRSNERWNEQSQKFEPLRGRIVYLLNEVGFLNEVIPHLKQYDGAIVHGALLPRVRLRLQYLVEQWKKGVRFPALYFLSGERPLDPEKENRKALLDDPKKRKDMVYTSHELPRTERQMAEWVWEQSDVPEDMRKTVKVHFINAPMKTDPKTQQKTVRPNTADTVQTWMKENPQPGNYLAVSNAPYIFRQDLEMRNLSSADFKFDTVGSAANPEEQAAILLDEIARLIFTVKTAKDKGKF